MSMPLRKKLSWLILITAFIRLLAAATLELGNDEVYYWTYSQQLQWNYFDHPPLVALLIRLSTANLWLQPYELFIRLGSIAGCAVATWLMYLIGKRLYSERVGWWMACLYNASIYAGIIAGLFILPDSPQMVFWCWSLLLLLKITDNEKSWTSWILLGISTGLCIMSKVHGVFIPFGLALFILFKKRAWLKLPQLYVSLLITAVLMSPILIWNIQNHFITYRYHSDRVTINLLHLNKDGFLRELFGQLFYNNPINVVLIVLGLIAWKKQKGERPPSVVLYQFIALPMAGVLLFVALFRDTLPHWSGPAYVTLLPLAALYLIQHKKEWLLPKSMRWALGMCVFAMVAGMLLIRFYPGTLGKKEKEKLGAGDFTLDMYGWTQAGKAFAQIYQQDVASGTMPAGAPLVSYKWFPAAHEDYYIAQPLGLQLIGLGNLHDLHHYVWLNRWHQPAVNLDKAYCLVPSNEPYNVNEKYAPYYRQIDSVGAFATERGGKTARYFFVYHLQGFKGTLPVAQ